MLRSRRRRRLEAGGAAPGIARHPRLPARDFAPARWQRGATKRRPGNRSGRRRAGSPMSVIDSVRKVLVPIHPEGYVFIAGFAVAAFVLDWFSPTLGWIGFIAT